MIIKIKIIFQTYHNREPLFVNLFVDIIFRISSLEICDFYSYNYFR